MKTKFDELFIERSDGSVTPRIMVKIGGIFITPHITLGGGMTIGGTPISRIIGKDLNVTWNGSVPTVEGFYG